MFSHEAKNLATILGLLEKVRESHPSVHLDEAFDKLTELANALKNQGEFDFALEMIASLAALDFGRVLPLTGDGSQRDGLAAGLNMLAEELKFAVVSKTEIESQKHFLQSILDASQSSIFVKSMDRKYVLVNSEFEKIMEVKRENVIGKTDSEIFSKINTVSLFTYDPDLGKFGSPHTIEQPLVMESGDKWFLTTKFPIKNKKDEVEYFGGFVTDITELRMKQTELEQTMAAINESSIIVWTDAKGKITSVNQNFTNISGFSRDEIVGRDHRIINSGTHPKKFFSQIWKIITSGQIWKGEIKNKTKEGKFYWVHTVISPVRDFSGKIYKFLAVHFDITAEKEAQQSLLQSSKMVSLGEMAAGIAHEINNPLAIIHGKAEQISREIEGGSFDLEKIRKSLSKIVTTAERIARIIKGLRAFSRNSETDPMENIKVSQIVDDTLELCKEYFKNSSIELRVNCSADIWIECRPSQVAQVLMNLLSNAHDAVMHLPEKWVNLDVGVKDLMVEISITDSGTGIEPKIVEKMMDPFFTTKDVGKGTGLGLSISKGIVAVHHGQLRYDSGCQHTRFILDLPSKQTNHK
jgi:PAS domain S-box-containing protein